MGSKEETVQGDRLPTPCDFRPGIIVGNAHTPRYAAWLGRLIQGRFGTIEQDDIGRALSLIHQQLGPKRGCVSRKWGHETEVSCG
jgi:hypothetical protein